MTYIIIALTLIVAISIFQNAYPTPLGLVCLGLAFWMLIIAIVICIRSYYHA